MNNDTRNFLNLEVERVYGISASSFYQLRYEQQLLLLKGLLKKKSKENNLEKEIASKVLVKKKKIGG